MSTGCQSQQSHGSEQGVRDFLAIPVIGIGFADNTENTENTDNQCENIIWSTKPSYWVHLFVSGGSVPGLYSLQFWKPQFEIIGVLVKYIMGSYMWNSQCECTGFYLLCPAWDLRPFWQNHKNTKTKKYTETQQKNDKKKKTSQELRMLSSVTIHCQITTIVMNSGSQLSEL